MSDELKAWTCKHGCERDALKEQIYALELANAELQVVLKHLVQSAIAPGRSSGAQSYIPPHLLHAAEKLLAKKDAE